MLNIADVQLCVLKLSLSSQDIGIDRNRDTVITKRCQNSHSIIESKLKVQFRNCVAHNNLGLALTINCSVRKKLKFICIVHHLLKPGENCPWDDSGLVL